MSENSALPRVVAVGASAGGLEALQQLFAQLPADTGCAFVVIQHLAAQRASALTELLGQKTAMPVAEVTETTPLAANHVYVIAPGTLLGIADDRLEVRAADGERHGPIDIFFQALAAAEGARSAGIVLSGFGDDGTAGLRAIRDAGGLTIAQAPETATHDGMPRSAIEAGVVAHVLPIVRMPAVLVEQMGAAGQRQPRVPASSPSAPAFDALPSEQDLERLYERLLQSTGHNFSQYKRGTVLRRLQRRMQARRASSLAAYLAMLAEEPQEVEALAKSLLISVTQFFRDPDSFQHLGENVIPQILLAAKSRGDDVRIWVPGCATGEEAYSLAILIRERIGELSDPPCVQIFATDIDADAISDARKGRYAADITSSVSVERLGRFFVRDGSHFDVGRELRQMCIFSEHSLIRDPPFLSLDLISCRHVLIYLDAALQKRLIPVFHYALRPGGFLFLGGSEGLAGHSELFEAIDKRIRLFRRLEPPIKPQVDFPAGARTLVNHAPRKSESSQPQPVSEQSISQAFQQLILQDYVPPAAAVSAKGDIVCVVGPTGRYLQPAAGVLSTNILEIADKALRIELRTALHSATRSGRKVVRENLLVEVDGEPKRLRLAVQPLVGIKGEGVFAVVLQEQGLEVVAAEAREQPPEFSESESKIEQLESELRATRDQLQATIDDLELANEELRSSNEELLSTNEEMISSNEELQSSQEELKSVNEELSTVNAELGRKLDELSRMNSDLQNLFASTDLATLFLDRELRLTRFTPEAKALFRLIDADVGRPFVDLAQRFANHDIAADVNEVLRTLQPIERQVENVDGLSWYLLRIVPYRTLEHVVAGSVITLTDLTQIRQGELEREQLLVELQAAHERLQADFDFTNQLMRLGTLLLQEGDFESLLGEIVDVAVSITGADFGNIQILDDESGELKVAAQRGFPKWWLDYWSSAGKGQGACDAALARNVRVIVEDIERDAVFAGTDALEIQRRAGVRAVQSTPLMSHRGDAIGVLSTHYRTTTVPDERALAYLDLAAHQAADFLARGRAERAMRESEARFRALVDVSADVLYRLSPDWTEMRELTSRGFLAAPPTAGKTWLQRYILPEDQPQAKALIDRAIQTHSPFELEHRILRVDGTLGWAWSRAVPLKSAQGAILEWFGAASDVTARKRAELELAEANKRLVEADRRKDEFLSVLSHELRNPLAPIRTNLDLIRRVGPGSERARRSLEVIDRQTRHMTRLVNDLLDVTRITSGKVVLQREILDVAELVRHAVEDYRDAYGEAGVAIELSAIPEVCRVDGDPTRLAQVIGNLLQNALKFTPSGGTVSVSVAQDPSHTHAVICVKDTGRGIPAELLARLYEPFMQVDTSLDRAMGGLGLGLAVAQAMVKLHGGSIAASSEGPGRGATFTIRLPLDTSLAVPTPEEAGVGVSRPGQRVLIIEDHVDAADALRDALECDGYTVENAYSGRKGLERAGAFAPDIVLCDIGLPEMNGYEVARALRADPQLAHVLLVALTGYSAPEHAVKMKEAGFDAHQAKPIDIDALVALLTELTSAHKRLPPANA